MIISEVKINWHKMDWNWTYISKPNNYIYGPDHLSIIGIVEKIKCLIFWCNWHFYMMANVKSIIKYIHNIFCNLVLNFLTLLHDSALQNPEHTYSDTTSTDQFSKAFKKTSKFNINLQLPTPSQRGWYWYDLYLPTRQF